MEQINKVEISELVGKKGRLYYCNEANSFILGSVKFEVVEDENDGYRSSMDYLKIVSVNETGRQFLSDIEVVDCSDESRTIYALRDVNDNTLHWVEFGTENTNDYYPYFVFRTDVKLPMNIGGEKVNIQDVYNKLMD